ncbi:sugar-binding domain-containing protein [Microbacterium sp. X-17]|uniref:sugar-binding transcriptional regulator n=1 Tax=Microbacterium sp. X-17 TaxID=3144404 RepID=UPI0031F5224E
MTDSTSAASLVQSTDERLPLVTKVAKLYHEAGLRQPEIAERLNLSQSRVSRLLKQATEAGIVRTVVISPEGLYSDLEQALTEKYGLIDAVVAEPIAADDLSVLAALGSAAALYLESSLSTTERIGISSWSQTLLATVNSMAATAPVRTTRELVQVLGGVGRPDVQVQANHLADQFARVTGAVPKFFPAPGVVGSKSARDALMGDRYLGLLASEWRNLTLLLAGIGTLEPSALLASSGNAVDEIESAALRAAGGVGDVCLRFFDEEGRPVETDFDDRVLGIDRDTLLTIPRRIGVAGGERKFTAIRGAIVGRWINILVTDRWTAQRLMA